MKYFLWVDEQQQGPYEAEQIREMLRKHEIALVTLGLPEDGTGEWNQIASFPGVIYGAESTEEESAPLPPASDATADSSSPYRPVAESGVSLALSVVAVVELVAAPIAGLVVGNESASTGWLIFAGGVISGLILLGFARVISHLDESAQRLREIELLLQPGRKPRKTRRAD